MNVGWGMLNNSITHSIAWQGSKVSNYGSPSGSLVNVDISPNTAFYSHKPSAMAASGKQVRAE